jgi:hypothetical protein
MSATRTDAFITTSFTDGDSAREGGHRYGHVVGRRRAALEDPAEALARSLAAGGTAVLAARLLELIPTGSISSDEHTAVLSGLLSELATHPELTTVERAEAARLAAVARDLPSGIGRAGTVWIAWFEPSKRARELGLPNQRGRYVTSWQPSDEGDHDLYETGPDFTSLTAALDWARQRSDRVVVRPEWDSGTHYSAGPAHADDEFPPLTQPQQ